MDHSEILAYESAALLNSAPSVSELPATLAFQGMIMLGSVGRLSRETTT